VGGDFLGEGVGEKNRIGEAAQKIIGGSPTPEFGEDGNGGSKEEKTKGKFGVDAGGGVVAGEEIKEEGKENDPGKADKERFLPAAVCLVVPKVGAGEESKEHTGGSDVGRKEGFV